MPTKKTVKSPERSTCDILNSGATKIEDMLIPTIFVAVPKKSHPKYQTPQDSKLAILRIKTPLPKIQVHYGSFTLPLEGPIADP